MQLFLRVPPRGERERTETQVLRAAPGAVVPASWLAAEARRRGGRDCGIAGLPALEDAVAWSGSLADLGLRGGETLHLRRLS